ncbi:MAG: DUF503 domain-containing protein [Chloroflexi bacterium]|nr:DUF503 domain-containing protein [Chloroflexota bacterium]MCY3696275.1 DUF503 domain-containing protein [Chloroflexota bacterium]MXX32889.1 DUF503 domain-containing protein [Chloroflexota bacterium]MYD16830.1 DUF503 domain-containing protein [Chloroflexota bacterium]MYJ01946.1 DUF503 domain-containing protein [Chloroflexota bacterium]
MTVVTVLTVELLIFESASLKDKRSVVRSVLQRTRNKFGVAAAEVDDQDDRTRAKLAFAAISSDSQISHANAQKVIEFLERERLDCQLGEVSTETFSL